MADTCGTCRHTNLPDEFFGSGYCTHPLTRLPNDVELVSILGAICEAAYNCAAEKLELEHASKMLVRLPDIRICNSRSAKIYTRTLSDTPGTRVALCGGAI